VALALRDCERARAFERRARELVDGQRDPFFARNGALINATNIPAFCPELTDFRRAQRFAERAIGLAPPPASAERGAQGIVAYRLGHHREAETTLRQVLRESRADEPLWRFYRAMALWKLGHTDEARHERGRAVAAAMARHEERRPDLVALRHEGEQMMNLRSDP
jgi:tetratricopeptide (TPR) repeat protein